MDIKQQKQRLQAAMKERILKIHPRQREIESRSVCKRLLESVPPGCTSVCAYMALKDELDIRAAIEAWLQKGLKVYLPCFHNNALTFRQLTDLTTMERGAFGIPEPSKDNPVLAYDDVQLALIPGRAFSPTGGRLGRGNGGYDKWMKNVHGASPQAIFWGIGFECQLTNEVPMEAHDVPVHAVITARGLTKPKV